jgi:hypothetical protein
MDSIEQPHRPSRFATVCSYCTAEGVPRRSFIVALVVGSLLNIINQGDVLLTGGPVNIAKLLLTFAVPYCVATYGAVSFRLQHEARSHGAAGDGAKAKL